MPRKSRLNTKGDNIVAVCRFVFDMMEERGEAPSLG